VGILLNKIPSIIIFKIINSSNFTVFFYYLLPGILLSFGIKLYAISAAKNSQKIESFYTAIPWLSTLYKSIKCFKEFFRKLLCLLIRVKTIVTIIFPAMIEI